MSVLLSVGVWNVQGNQPCHLVLLDGVSIISTSRHPNQAPPKLDYRSASWLVMMDHRPSATPFNAVSLMHAMHAQGGFPSSSPVADGGLVSSVGPQQVSTSRQCCFARRKTPEEAC